MTTRVETYEDYVNEREERRSLESMLGTMMSVAAKFDVYLHIPDKPGDYKMDVSRDENGVYINFKEVYHG